MKSIHRLKDFAAYSSAIASPIITIAKLGTVKASLPSILINFLYSEPMEKALAYLLLISMASTFFVLFIVATALVRRVGRNAVKV
ncbi:MAG: hypothetical protein QW632_00025 [Ignisphaera sp.]